MTSGTAVVTGATGGIGSAICRRLAVDGYEIVAAYHSNHEAAHTLSQDVSAMGGRLYPVCCDLATPDGVHELVAAIRDRTSKESQLHALVNNAAKLLGPSFHEATEAQFDAYFALNVRAPFFLAQQLCQLMPTGASIVNVSSAGAHFSSPGDIVYAMTKAAIESLTRNVAEAVAPYGIRVNTVIPGFTDNGHEAFRIQEVRDYMDSFAVLGGVAQPADVANAVSFLVSDQARRTTGAALDVTGGSILGARRNAAASVRHIIP